MGTSFISIPFGDKHLSDSQRVRTGIWVNDSFLQLVLRLLVLHVPEPPPGEEGAESRAIRDQWLLASGVTFTGCVPHELDTISTSANGLLIIRGALKSLSAAMNDMPAELPGPLFSLLGMGEPATAGIRMQDLQSTVADILSLLNVDRED